MNTNTEILKTKTIQLIKDLQSVCTTYGLAGTGNEYKIITQVVLYKFLNDKFAYVMKQKSDKLRNAEDWASAYAAMPEGERKLLLMKKGPNVATFLPHHLLSFLYSNINSATFGRDFDDTLIDLADTNAAIFSTVTSEETKVGLFDRLTNFITDEKAKINFARAVVNKLISFSFEDTFDEHYDFFSEIFEYVAKSYNQDSGGKYAEYYTPRSIARVMARLLVGDDASDLHNIECYDPSAGTGSLLMALAHQIGEDKCTIFSQDIAVKSSELLRFNLVLNGLVSSLPHAIQGDTMVNPYHRSDDKKTLKQFDYIISNPPFKLDFSETHAEISSKWGASRFWAGIPSIPNKKKESMAIYTLFFQHVVNSLKDTGKGAIIVPTGFITSKSGVEGRLLAEIVERNVVWGVISFPSNVFGTTGTNVSVVFLDKAKADDKIILIDASKLGEDYTDEDKGKKHRLLPADIELIVDTFRNRKVVDDFSVLVSKEEVQAKGNSLSAGQYFDIKIEYVDITEEEFNSRMATYKADLQKMFAESKELESEIMKNLESLNFEK